MNEPDPAQCLAATPFIDSDHERIRAQLADLNHAERPQRERAVALFEFVRDDHGSAAALAGAVWAHVSASTICAWSPDHHGVAFAAPQNPGEDIPARAAGLAHDHHPP